MKANALQAFRQKLKDDEPVYGLWSTLPSPSITEMAVAAGLDWVTIGRRAWLVRLEHDRGSRSRHLAQLDRAPCARCGTEYRAFQKIARYWGRWCCGAVHQHGR